MLKQDTRGLETRLSSTALQIRYREIQLYHESFTESGLGLMSALLTEMAIMGLVRGATNLHHYSRKDVGDPVLVPGSATHAVFVLLLVGSACAALNALVVAGELYQVSSHYCTFLRISWFGSCLEDFVKGFLILFAI